MRRPALLIAAVLVAATASPASAAITTQVVHGLPPNMYALTQNCVDESLVDVLLVPTTGPASVPSGTGSLAVPVAAGHRTAIWTSSVVDPASLGTWKGDLHVGTAGIQVDIVTQHYLLVATVSSVPDSWNFSDYAGQTYTVYDLATLTEVATQNLAQFVAAHPSETSANLGVIATNCDGTSATTAYLDDYTIATSAGGTTYDFEPGLPISISATAPSRITAGTVAVVHAKVTSNGVAVRNVSVRLMAGTPGTGQLVGTYVSDSTGTVSAAVRPLATTTYYWEFPGNAKYDPQRSTTRTVQVATKLTLSASTTTMRVGRTLVLTAKAYPHHPGSTVTFWRTTTSGRTKLGSGTLGSTGTLLFAKVLRTMGAYRLFATIPAVDGDVGGRSGTVTVTVR